MNRDMKETKEVYCPVCRNDGRKKLLFKKDMTAKGKILVWCRGCKSEIEIVLDRAIEP